MSFPLEKLKLLPSKRETFFFAFLDVSDHLEAKIKNKIKVGIWLPSLNDLVKFWLTLNTTKRHISMHQVLDGVNSIFIPSLEHLVEEQGVSEQSHPYSPNYNELEDWKIVLIKRTNGVSSMIVYYLGKLPFSHSHNQTLYAVPVWYILHRCLLQEHLLDWTGINIL